MPGLAERGLGETKLIRIGTRRSALALWQARHIRDCLIEHWGDQLKIELVEIVTEGDKILDRPLNLVGGKGLFVNAIEEKLLSKEVDLAVHSMKDLPAELAPGLEIVCTPVREDARDVMVGPEEARLAKLQPGTRVGTSSLRRGALARRLNAGIELIPIRGNVQTRLAKIEEGVCDAVLLAAAGLKRLGMEETITEYLDLERFCPAACQGILALECRQNDEGVKELVSVLNDPMTAVAAAAERAFLAHLEGGCQVPMGCYAEVRAEDVITVNGVVADPSGRPCFIATKAGSPGEAAELGQDLAETLLRLGAGQVLQKYSTQRKSA